MIVSTSVHNHHTNFELSQIQTCHENTKYQSNLSVAIVTFKFDQAEMKSGDGDYHQAKDERSHLINLPGKANVKVFAGSGNTSIILLNTDSQKFMTCILCITIIIYPSK